MLTFELFENPFGDVFDFIDNMFSRDYYQNQNKNKSKYDIMRELAEDVEFEEIIVNEDREQEPIKMLE